MTNQDIIQQLIDKTTAELKAAEFPIQDSRSWTDPKGYQYLGVWQNLALLRVMVRIFTNKLLPKREFRLKAQLDDAIRSAKRNIEEGWKRASTGEYNRFISFSQGSLEEVRGDIRDCKTDGFLLSQPLSTLKSTLNIDLSVTKGKAKGEVKGEPTEPGHPYYKPLTTLNSQPLTTLRNTLTYEVFMELINKTDWLLRKLVESLEIKLRVDKGSRY